jgi:hypothetical protein
MGPASYISDVVQRHPYACVRRAARVRPEYRVLRPLEWRAAGDHVELRDPSRDTWTAFAAWTRVLFEAIERGDTLARIARDVRVVRPAGREEKAVLRVRRLVLHLWRIGYLDLPVDAPPAVFDGRYRLVKELGRGGVGVAYLCRDERSGEEVVVKRAWDFLAPYSVTEDAMRKEADVMSRFDHPGIARMSATFHADGHLHLVREFVRGDDLLRVRERGPIGVEERRAIVAGIAGILAHIHDRGFLLIDLRPPNFVIDPAVGPRLLDVGACRALRDGAAAFTKRIGSPGFVSPEMEQDRVVTIRSDVWGLGRLLYFLGVGALPESRWTADELAARAPPEDRVQLLRLSADDPGERPATMRDAAALLRTKPS